VRSVAWVPEVAGELAVGGIEEGLEVFFVLADEQDDRRDAVGGEWGMAPPPAQQGVVAEELFVVLVDPSSAVVFDEVEPGAGRGLAGDFEDGVGSYEACSRVSDALDGAFVVEAFGFAAVSWWLDLRLAAPRDERRPEEPSPGQGPGVGVDLVQDVAVVVDRAEVEACAGFKLADLT
jgi:hypothetical protein